MYSDSGVVTRMCGGRLSIARRSCISVSPVRTAVRISRHQQAALARQLQDFAERDFQVLLDVVAQRLQRRDVEDFGPVVQLAGERFADQPINAGEKRGQRLARPVGAEMSVVRPARISGQPCACGSVGSPNLRGTIPEPADAPSPGRR